MPTQEELTDALACFWHPVCTLDELRAAPGGVLAVRLLGRELVVADLGAGRLTCLVDRCLHRSTRLSVGCVEQGTIRCAYHGWRWDHAGVCVEIPSAPATPIAARAVLPSFSTAAHHGLVWVRLDDRADLPVPRCPGFEDPSMKMVAGEPYTWPVSAGRRVENFTDLSHFAWVHDATLGRRDQPVPPLPEVRRHEGALRFEYTSPELDDQSAAALMGHSDYHVFMPGTVNIEFAVAGRPGVRRHLWMTASPLDAASCRTFWYLGRNDPEAEPDAELMEFQDLILAQDAPVVCNQDPLFPLAPAAELSVKADRVSLEYRRWLVELVGAARQGPEALRSSVSEQGVWEHYAMSERAPCD